MPSFNIYLYKYWTQSWSIMLNISFLLSSTVTCVPSLRNPYAISIPTYSVPRMRMSVGIFFKLKKSSGRRYSDRFKLAISSGIRYLFLVAMHALWKRMAWWSFNFILLCSKNLGIAMKRSIPICFARFLSIFLIYILSTLLFTLSIIFAKSILGTPDT